MEGLTYWRKCGPCKREIAFGSLHYLCSVASCRKQVFCSKDCWSAHVPVMRHKDAWPEEAYAPAREAASQLASSEGSAELRRRRVVSSGHVPAARGSHSQEDQLPQDILIVASKLKQYIKAKSQMNTSAQVLERLSDIVRIHCDEAMRRAREDGRKTVLDRDFVF